MRSVIEVNTENLRWNWNELRRIVGFERKIIAVLKSNGYGVGAVEVGRVLGGEGADYFAISYIEEGIELREGGIGGDILMLSPYIEEDIEEMMRYSLKPTVVDSDRVKALNNFGYKKGWVIGVNIKVDTGMGRLGLRVDEMDRFLEEIEGYQNIRIEGIYTHCPSSYIPDIEFTRMQIEKYGGLVEDLRGRGLSFMSHMMNSGGIAHFGEAYFDGVRPGILLYGEYSAESMRSKVNVKPVVSWKGRVIAIKELEAGESISYGRYFIAKEKMRIGLVNVGYNDGYSTLLTGVGEVVVGGERVNVLGRVCMNYIVIDLRKVKNIKLGAEVYLLGEGINAGELSRKSGLVVHEVLTGLSDRLERVYI